MNNPVAPIVGHYALLRNGEAVGPVQKFARQPYLFTARLPHMSWREDGVSDWDDSDFDIIATISPEAMQMAASGELERLRASLKRMLLEYDFMVEAGLIPDTRDDVIFVEARAALKGWTE